MSIITARIPDELNGEFSKLMHDIKRSINDYIRQKVIIAPRKHGSTQRCTSNTKLWIELSVRL